MPEHENVHPTPLPPHTHPSGVQPTPHTAPPVGGHIPEGLLHSTEKARHILSVVASVLTLSGIRFSRDTETILGVILAGGIGQEKIDRIKTILAEPEPSR